MSISKRSWRRDYPGFWASRENENLIVEKLYERGGCADSHDGYSIPDTYPGMYKQKCKVLGTPKAQRGEEKRRKLLTNGSRSSIIHKVAE